MFGSDGPSTVTVKSANGHSHTFDVNQNNKLLYQERSLQDIPEKYSIEVKGSSCVSVQVSASNISHFANLGSNECANVNSNEQINCLTAEHDNHHFKLNYYSMTSFYLKTTI